MDGFAHSFAPLDLAEGGCAVLADTPRQRTLKAPINCTGVGLHNGRKVNLTLRPAAIGHGIVFHRTDLGRSIPARYDFVADTRLCTVLADRHDPAMRVCTIEHVMAALAGVGVDNAVVEIDGPEIPILDGSAAGFVFLLECAGIVDQDAARPVIEVLHPVRVQQGGAFVELRPHDPTVGDTGLHLTVAIDFDATAIGHQALSMRLTPETFRGELARARTFTLACEVEQLHAAGLALGGSLDNAIVVDRSRVLNPGGLRMADEFVRHKMLDLVGDLALAGSAISGRCVGNRSGHALNNRLLRALFSDPTAWRRGLPGTDAPWSAAPIQAAA